MKSLLSKFRTLAWLSCAMIIASPALRAGNYTASGTISTATWPWYAPWQVSQQQLAYSGTISDNLTTGGGGGTLVSIPPGQTPGAVIEAIAYPTNGPYANSSFNINTLLYSAVGGNWATYSGRIDLEIGYYESPYIFSRRTIMSVSYENGIANGFVPFSSGNGYDTGTRGAEKQALTWLGRLAAIGGPVQLATGAEAASRPLFSFQGARNWGFGLSYNSVLARRQIPVGPSNQGFGWTHEYDIRLSVSGANLVVQRGGGSESLFVPDAQTSGLYVSNDDNSRYDRITTQAGGGWLLTRRDQSSLLFNGSGLLIEDRDPQGHKLVLTYAGTRISRIADPVSNTFLDFAYNGSNYLASLTDASGAIVSIDYYPNTPVRLRTITNQRGKQATFNYDTANMALLTLVDETTTTTLTTNTYDVNDRVITQNDGVTGNQVMGFAYQEIGRPGGVIYAPSDTAKLVPLPIAVPGRLRTDNIGLPNGQTITYAHDTNGRLTTATVGSQVTTVNYDTVGNVVSITDPANVTTTVVPRIVTTVTDRNGKPSVHTFDPNYNLLSVKDALNHTTSYTYDSANRLTSVTDPLSRTNSYTYDTQGNVLTATDPAGKVTTYTYDARNNLLTTTLPAPAAGQPAPVTTRTYDANNNLLTLQDALGRTTTWTYNSNSLPITMTLPGGGVYNYTYTAGRLTQVTDPNSVVTNFGYDANGRLLYREDALGKRVTFTYDALGNVLTVKNALNETTTYTYDHRNRVATITDPAGAVTTNTYDHNHNLLAATVTASGLPTLVTTYTYDGEDRLKTVTTPDPDTTGTGAGKDPLVTTYNYDDAGRLTSIVAPGGTTTFAYDVAGQLTSVTDPAGKVTASEYDPRGLLTKVTDPLTRATNLAYDDIGRRKTVTDPLSRVTTLDYDALHRVTKITDPGSLVAEQGFDLNGNRTSLKNPASAVTAFVYDAGGRLTTATTPQGHATGYTYNTRGLPASVVEPSAQTTSFAYDDAQRLTSTTDPVGTITYGRDSAGRVTTVVEGAKTLTRAYDAHGRLTSYTDGDGNVIGYTYDELGRLKKLTYPGTPVKEVTYAYDGAGRLGTVTDWASRVTTYSYDAVGRLTQLLRPNGTKQTRAYDDAGQLSQLTELAPDGTTVFYSGAHSYDAAGQLTGETILPALAAAIVSTTQTFDADNRLLTHNGAATTFDADGNLLSVASGITPASYTYDARNRLAAAGGLSYGYNAENRRVSVTDASGTTSYVVNPNALPDQVLIKTASDGTKTFYVYGLGLLHEETGGTPRYYHFDRRGDTIALSDNAGAITGRVAYGVYGEILSQTGTIATPFLFNGRWGVQTDSNGLYHHRARYYHPQLRRFLNQDTVLGGIGDSGSMNRFAYTNGNPVSLIDPFGLMAQDAGVFFAKYLWGVATSPFMIGYSAGTGLVDMGSLLMDGQAWRDYGRMLRQTAENPVDAKLDEVRAWSEVGYNMVAGLQDPVNLGNFVGGFAWGAAARIPLTENQGGLVLGKMKDLENPSGWVQGDYILAPGKPYMWENNLKLLQAEMGKKKPIGDRNPFNDTGRLGDEHTALRDAGWSWDKNTGKWMPPKG
jgi:RHS repeat-associated protein